ncbi:MAG: hypothetical protein ACI392_08815 [Paludibacteraceae bacterium]
MAKKESYLWTSYSDLMTSLFFVMMVLFVLSLAVVRQNNREIIQKNADLCKMQESLAAQNEELIKLKDSLANALEDANVTIEQQNRILRIDEQFRPLQRAGLFKYFEQSKKYVAKDLLGVEIFEPNGAKIVDRYKQTALNVGYVIDTTLRSLHNQSPDFKYLLVIEGNVANTYDYKYDKDGAYGYKLSYERALSVYTLWQQNGIDLRQYNTEVLLCGSGWNGLDRDVVEEYNKRFSIQILPKVSSPNDNIQ